MLLRRALLLLGVARAGKVCTGGQHYEQAAAAQCAVIEGDLLIQNTNLTNVLLSHLQSVEGRLYITGNSALENLGFASLTHIGGSLYVSGNGALKNLDGLRSLESVSTSYAEIANADDTDYAAFCASPWAKRHPPSVCAKEPEANARSSCLQPGTPCPNATACCSGACIFGEYCE